MVGAAALHNPPQVTEPVVVFIAPQEFAVEILLQELP